MREDSLDFDKLGIHLDKTDIKILKLLANDSRISYAEIAREVHLSRMAVRERVMKMVEEGVVERFTVQLDSKKVGLNTPVFLQVEAAPSKLDDVANELAKHPKIESVCGDKFMTVAYFSMHLLKMLKAYNNLFLRKYIKLMV